MIPVTNVNNAITIIALNKDVNISSVLCSDYYFGIRSIFIVVAAFLVLLEYGIPIFIKAMTNLVLLVFFSH
jgi:hypothetical protein